jgi:hypothetical protein
MRSAEIVSDECDRLLAEVRATSQKAIFPEIESELLLLKRSVWQNSLIPPEKVLSPFLTILRRELATDVITNLVLSSIQTFLRHSIVTDTKNADILCSDLISSTFQSTSDYDCSCVFHQILSTILILMEMRILSPASITKLWEYLCHEISQHQRSPPPFLNNTFFAVIDFIFTLSNIELECNCVQSLFFLADNTQKLTSSTVRHPGILGLLSISRKSALNPRIDEMLMISSFSLLTQQLNSVNDSRDNFVLILRFFFNISRSHYENSILPFSKCFALLLKFIADVSIPQQLRVDCLEVVSDFIVQRNSIGFIFANFHGRSSFPELFSLLVNCFSDQNSLADLDSALAFFEAIPDSPAADFESENREFAELEAFGQKFNAKPSEFVDRPDLPPDQLARLLFIAPNLTRQSVGAFFGRAQQFCIDTLNCFLGLFDFRSLDFDSSIRLFLSSFQIVGEGQIVDRIFSCFAAAFYASHSGSTFFASAESVHLLAYGWLMIHTSFHNTNVTKKPLFDDFSKMLQGQNGGQDFDTSFLRSLFTSIKTSIIPFEDSQQINSFGYWRLLMQRQRILNLPIKDCVAGSGGERAAELFEGFFAVRSERLIALAEKGNDESKAALEKCLIAAEGYRLEGPIDFTVRRFCQFVLRDLAEDTVTGSLGFLAEVVLKHGNSVREAWQLYVEVLITLFQLDLAHEDLLTFADICDDCRPVVLSQHCHPEPPELRLLQEKDSFFRGSPANADSAGNQRNRRRHKLPPPP